jgi:murein DD-endopeptidase MepM/ murein hydrolase activator NlpD
MRIFFNRGYALLAMLLALSSLTGWVWPARASSENEPPIGLGFLALAADIETPEPKDEADGSPVGEDSVRPFRLPFEGAPGPDTWMLGQPYGNTVFAYRERVSLYRAGQGLHFGVDLRARCGTRVVAIGEGTVVKVDSVYHGAGPHNVMINHANGYASFYGHLLARANLRIGQNVKAGQLVGLSGDPDLTCTSRPHLHLEIRDAPQHRIAYNPLTLIDADWERIALAGGAPVGFELDLQHLGRWTSLEDQPDVTFGEPLVNSYFEAWPPDW